MPWRSLCKRQRAKRHFMNSLLWERIPAGGRSIDFCGNVDRRQIRLFICAFQLDCDTDFIKREVLFISLDCAISNSPNSVAFYQYWRFILRVVPCGSCSTIGIHCIHTCMYMCIQSVPKKMSTPGTGMSMRYPRCGEVTVVPKVSGNDTDWRTGSLLF